MRITNNHKEEAKKYIKEKVLDEGTLPELVKAEAALSAKMVKQLLEKFPPADMCILAKYNHASRINNIIIDDIRDENYDRLKIKISEFVEKPSRYPNEHSEFSTGTNYFDSLKKDIESFGVLWKRHRALSKALQDKYYNLLNSCTTFKQLAEYWPECIKVFPRCLDKNNTALICVSQEDLKFIKQDSLKRLKKENK